MPQEAWFGWSAVPFGGLIVIGVALLLEHDRALYWLAGVEVLLLLIATFNTWALLARARPEA